MADMYVYYILYSFQFAKVFGNSCESLKETIIILKNTTNN